MKQALILLTGLIAVFQLGYHFAGYQAVYQVAYGAITLMAALISGTFLWLFLVRATPLALGMAYSWAGAASVMGWWWVYNASNRPDWASDSPLLFLFLPLYFVGAVLHFAVIHRSLGLHGIAFTLPVAVSVLASLLLYIAF